MVDLQLLLAMQWARVIVKVWLLDRKLADLKPVLGVVVGDHLELVQL